MKRISPNVPLQDELLCWSILVHAIQYMLNLNCKYWRLTKNHYSLIKMSCTFSADSRWG